MDGERRLKWAGSIRNIKIRNRLLEDKEAKIIKRWQRRCTKIRESETRLSVERDKNW